MVFAGMFGQSLSTIPPPSGGGFQYLGVYGVNRDSTAYQVMTELSLTYSGGAIQSGSVEEFNSDYTKVKSRTSMYSGNPLVSNLFNNTITFENPAFHTIVPTASAMLMTIHCVSQLSNFTGGTITGQSGYMFEKFKIYGTNTDPDTMTSAQIQDVSSGSTLWTELVEISPSYY